MTDHTELLKNLTLVRPLQGSDWKNVQADVITMFGHCIHSMASACSSKSWPELFEMMEKQTNSNLDGEVCKMHHVVAKLLKFVDEPGEKDSEERKRVDSLSIFEVLEEVEWDKVDAAGRATYLAMLGLYFISRIWVVGRQQQVLGINPGKVFEVVAEAAGDSIRVYDQKLDTYQDLAQTVRAATHHALQRGVSRGDIKHMVEMAVLSYAGDDDVDRGPLAKLTPLTTGRTSCETPNESNGCCGGGSRGEK